MNTPVLTPRGRFRLWQGLVAGLVATWTVWLVWTWSRPDSVGVLIAGWLTVGGLLLGMVALLLTTPLDAIMLPRQRSERLILGLLAAILGLTVLLASPVWSDDHERYLGEGAMWWAGVSPYAVAVGSFDPHTRANHAELASIYPPFAQAVFAVVTGLARWSGVEPLLVLRGAMGVAAGSAAWVLMRLLARQGRSAWWAAPVVLSGLWVFESAGTPHVDIVGVLAMLLALRAGSGGRSFLAGVFLVLACGVKPQVGVLLPFLMRSGSGRAVFAGFLLAGLPQLGVLLWQGGLGGFLETSFLYASRWEANGAIFEGLKALSVLGDDRAAIARLKDVGRMAGPVAVVLAFWLCWHFRSTPATAGLVIQGVLLLLSPVVYPWYLLWLLPLAVLVPSPATGVWALVWGVTVVWSYLLGRLGVGWTLPAWVLLLEYLPVYACLLCVLVVHLRPPPGPRTMGA